jgi:peptidoglycan hydrolase-like protein with peptidoglycan-binding domain
VALTVDGRPAFVLPGAIPMHRDLHQGDRGPDVRQLERAQAGIGFQPGAVDGRFDASTAAAVSSFYLRAGWDPFGPTRQQLDQLQTAEAAAAAARDAHLQAVNNVAQAGRPQTPGDLAQARIDVGTARDAVDTAVFAVASARAKLTTVRRLAAAAPQGEAVAVAESGRDLAAAAAEVVAKQSDLAKAVDDEQIARMKLNELALDALPSDREAAAAALRQSSAAVARAQADLATAVAAANAVRVSGASTVQKARNDAAQATVDVSGAKAELRRARLAVVTARRQVRLTRARVGVLARPPDTSTLRAIATSSASEARRTRAEVARLSREAGVQVPADEILFFPTLPVRVDTVTARRGNAVSGPVMTVTGSRLAVDSSLSVSDVKLVEPGDPVAIEDPDLGVKTRGTVTRVSSTPGTNRVDPGRFYLVVTPSSGSRSLVGASVKLTIAVKSTSGAVLAVPPSALSVGGDGNARLQVSRGGRLVFVRVAPGLAARGLVEVRALGRGRLRAGELVVVGSEKRAGGP